MVSSPCVRASGCTSFPNHAFLSVEIRSPLKDRMMQLGAALALSLLWRRVCSYWGRQRTYRCSIFARRPPPYPPPPPPPTTPDFTALSVALPLQSVCTCLGWNGNYDICCLPVCLTQLRDESLCRFVGMPVRTTAAAFSHSYWEKTTVFPVGVAPLLWIKKNMLRL